MFAQSGALDRLEEAGRDDLVGVDVGDLQRRRDRRQGGELVHGRPYPPAFGDVKVYPPGRRRSRT